MNRARESYCCMMLLSFNKLVGTLFLKYGLKPTLVTVIYTTSGSF